MGMCLIGILLSFSSSVSSGFKKCQSFCLMFTISGQHLSAIKYSWVLILSMGVEGVWGILSIRLCVSSQAAGRRRALPGAVPLLRCPSVRAVHTVLANTFCFHSAHFAFQWPVSKVASRRSHLMSQESLPCQTFRCDDFSGSDMEWTLGKYC